jgi:hypothetical protein
MRHLPRRLCLGIAGVAFVAALVAPAVAQAGGGTNSSSAGRVTHGKVSVVPKHSWAVVAADGTLVRSTPDVLSSSLIAAGAYQVLTNHDVTGCTYVADPGVTGSVGAIGQAAFSVTALRAGTTNGVFVNTFDRTGTFPGTSFPFHLHINCDPKGYEAVINGDGTVSRGGSQLSGAIHLGTGSYEVDYFRKVARCAYTANVGNPGAGNPAALTIDLASRAGNKFGIYVQVKDTSGALTDSSFHVDIACGATKPLDAVVDSTGTFVRGANATGSIHLGTGAYEVDFNRNVASCSFVASIAQPHAGVSAQGTATVAGRNGVATGVFVQTFDLGGTQVDRPFHLIVNC